ncbi:MAG: MinD/ParA family protein [Deltaproteobacteria bacterium]|nr:MAG: MinD/ParA family protein [Deltaproteobacteria bacterium]
MPQIWPIGGGKGGTGKSFVTGSLGILLAREGYQTLLIDLDLGAANLHTTIGAPNPEKSLSDFVNKKVASLDETIVPTPTPNLFMISGAMNNLDIANLAHEQKTKILREIAKLPYDHILLDLGAGTSFNTIDFFMISNSGIFITTPEPTSTENIYRLIRSVYFRKIRQVLNVQHFRALAKEAEEQNSKATVTNPDLLLDMIKKLDPEKGRMLEQELNTMEFGLLMNQHRKQDNPNIGRFICQIIEKHLALKIQFLGNIAFDDNVHLAICNKRPLLEMSPYAKTASDLRECFKKLLIMKDKSSGIRYAVDQIL